LFNNQGDQMRYYFVLLIAAHLFLFSSCEKKSQYSVNNAIASITPLNVGAEDADVVPWTVGLLGKQKVAKGVKIKVKFPQLETDDIEDLVNNRGADSWLIRVRRRNMGRSEVLGFLYVPIVLPGTKESGQMRIKQTKGGFFSVYYAAAALSSRFEKFDCPAFDHDKWIEEIKIEKENGPGSVIATSPSEMETISARVEAFSYSPITLNGGRSLSGEYIIDLALYNQSEKRKMSNYLELEDRVIVSNEVSVPLEGCTGFKIPPKEEEKSQPFKFGR